MGFSIGRFLGAIAGPVIGLATGNPLLGAAIATGASAAFDEPSAAATIGRATQPGPVSVAPSVPSQQFAGFPVAPTSLAPSFQTAALSPILRAMPPLIGGAAIGGAFGNGGRPDSPIKQILDRARFFTKGPVTRNKIIDAAKVCGLETAAQTFGLDIRQVCLVVVKGRTRRRRGVSAADIRRTKRTIGFASKIRKDLKALAR